MNVQAALAAVVADLETAAFRLQRLANGAEDPKVFSALQAKVEGVSKEVCIAATALAEPAASAEEPKIVKTAPGKK